MSAVPSLTVIKCNPVLCVIFTVPIHSTASLCASIYSLPYPQAHGSDPIIPFSGAFESQVSELPEDQREAFFKEQGAVSAIPKIVTTGFKTIQLIYFFTAGPDEVKCWQIKQGTKAPQVWLCTA